MHSRSWSSRILAAAAFLGLLLQPSLGLVEHLFIDNDPRSLFLIDQFGYQEGGKLELKLKDLNLMVPYDYTPPADEVYKIALVIVQAESAADSGAIESMEANRLAEAKASGGKAGCFHESPEQQSADGFSLIPLTRREHWDGYEYDMTMYNSGLYFIFMSNCETGTNIGFDLTLIQYNTMSDGTKNYLTIGLNSLPHCSAGFPSCSSASSSRGSSLCANTRIT